MTMMINVKNETGMACYWDMEERDRAKLTRDDVLRYVDAELMMKGVLAVPSLVLVEEPAVTLAKNTLYRVDLGAYDRFDVAFVTEEAARAFLRLQPVRVRSDWQLGSENYFTESMQETGIRTEELPTRATIQDAKGAMQEQKAAKDENDRRRKAHEEQTKKVDDALKGLWEDWHACRAKADRVARVTATFQKYVTMAGSDAVAARFLRQAFTRSELEETEAWTGTKFPSTPGPLDETTFPRVATVRDDDDTSPL